jgi:hypothetical protein
VSGSPSIGQMQEEVPSATPLPSVSAGQSVADSSEAASNPEDAEHSIEPIATELDPFNKDYKQTLLPDTLSSNEVTNRDIMYSFIHAARVSVLKGPGGSLKKHKLPQSLNKQAMVAALFQVVCKAVSDSAS